MRHYEEVNRVTRKIHKVMQNKPPVWVRLRVCAYARVSSNKEAMLHSLSTQVSHYSGYIQQNSQWEYAGVYVDEAITGTKDNRADFQRMVADCRAGKIDMVITKSISRFARNTVTLLETVRELKALGIDVYFEEQNIHSISEGGELMLSILASYAQEESRNVSENCKWRIRKQFEAGEPANWRFLYGYRIRKGRVWIEPEEALVVRWVFESYLSCVGVTEISEIMRERNIPSYRGGVWSPKRVLDMLKNEKYAGNALLQKKYVVDHLTKLEKINRGELPKYFSEGTHPAIIPPEMFFRVQEQMEGNRIRNGIERKAPQYTAFTGMICCDKCGKRYRRKVSRTETAWNCGTYLVFGKKHCHTKQIPEEILISTTASVLGLTEFDEAVFKERVQELRVPAFNHLIYVFKDGSMVERVWTDKSRSESWTSEMKTQASMQARMRYAQ